MRFKRLYPYAGTRELRKLSFDNTINARFGGSDDPSYTVVQPAVTPAPTVQDSMADYVASMPALYNVQLEYLPKMAQMAKSITENLYPQTAGLTEQLAQEAQKGLSEEPPAWYMQKQSDLAKAQFGRNMFNPQGQQAYTNEVMEGWQNWKNYYSNMGLSLLNRQNLVQAPSYETMTAGYSPNTAMSYNLNAYNSYQGFNQPKYLPNYSSMSNPWSNFGGMMTGIGQTLGGVGGGMTGLSYLMGAM